MLVKQTEQIFNAGWVIGEVKRQALWMDVDIEAMLADVNADDRMRRHGDAPFLAMRAR